MQLFYGLFGSVWLNLIRGDSSACQRASIEIDISPTNSVSAVAYTPSQADQLVFIFSADMTGVTCRAWGIQTHLLHQKFLALRIFGDVSW